VADRIAGLHWRVEIGIRRRDEPTLRQQASRRVSDETLGHQALALSKRIANDLANYAEWDPRTLTWGTQSSMSTEQQETENRHRARRNFTSGT
jgi:hypothetical protein